MPELVGAEPEPGDHGALGNRHDEVIQAPPAMTPPALPEQERLGAARQIPADHPVADHLDDGRREGRVALLVTGPASLDRDGQVPALRGLLKILNVGACQLARTEPGVEEERDRQPVLGPQRDRKEAPQLVCGRDRDVGLLALGPVEAGRWVLGDGRPAARLHALAVLGDRPERREIGADRVRVRALLAKGRGEGEDGVAREGADVVLVAAAEQEGRELLGRDAVALLGARRVAARLDEVPQALLGERGERHGRLPVQRKYGAAHDATAVPWSIATSSPARSGVVSSPSSTWTASTARARMSLTSKPSGQPASAWRSRA